MNPEFYEALFVDHPDPMWIFDVGTLRFLAVNQAALDKYGYSRDEFLALTLRDIRPEEDLHHLQRVLDTHVGIPAETGVWRHRRKNGEQLYVDVRTRPVQYEGCSAKLVSARDVTPQVLLELERQDLMRKEQASRQAAEQAARDIALRVEELNASNASLLQQQLLYRNIQRMVNLGSWQLQLDTGKLSWSDDIYPIFGVDRESFGHSFESFLALVHPDDVGRLQAAQEQVFATGQSFDIEHRLLRPDGSVRIVREVGELVDTPQGRVLNGVVKDITRQRQTELRLQDTLESMTDGFFTLDRNWCFRFINSEFERIFGVTRQQLLGRYVWDCFPEARNTHFQRNYEEAVCSGKATSFIEFLGGYDKWLRVKAYPGPDGIAVYFQDITQERVQEEAVRISEERFEYIAKATNDAVWDWNLGADTIWWNVNFIALTGHDPVALGGDSSVWSRFIHPDDRQRVLQGIHAVIDGQDTSWRDEYRFICADGRELVLIDRGFVIRDDSGKAVRMVGSMVDVTENRELAQKLLQSQKLESIGQLTGGIAHDFNNLLTVVMGNAETLEEQLDVQPQLKPLARMITRAAQRGAELTNRLLAFARRQVLEPKVVDLAQQLPAMEQLLQRVLTEDIDIRLVTEEALWLVEVDPGQLEVALLNLVINARDAMAEGGSLTIDVANVELDNDYARDNLDASAGAYVVISVTDTGSGMPPAVLARAFEPFFTTKEAGKGSGLGLSMVYGFVKQSGGFARIYTEQGEGTTIRLYFPRVQAAMEESGIEESVDVQRPAGRESILVVEDDAGVRQHVCQLLQELGFRVACATNGAEALEQLRSSLPFDLLFTDVVMPGGISGKRLADLATELRPGLRVLFTSGYTQNSIVHQGRLDPGVELLGKPYRKQQLAAKLRKVLDQS